MNLNLLNRIGISRHRDQLSEIGWVNFLVFARNMNGSSPQKLKVNPADLTSHEVTINNIHCDKDGVCEQIELHFEPEQPPHKDITHVGC